MATAVPFSIYAALFFGSYPLPAEAIHQALADMLGHGETQDLVIVRDIRLGRILLSFLTGAALAVSGGVFQGLLRNPLADPFTLGISSGAACGAALAIGLGWTMAGASTLPLSALAGAFAAMILVLLLSRLAGGFSRESLVLSGIVVSTFLGALIADPGYRLVAACRRQGISVVPVPGPCAPITALMASGLPPYPFVFLGFLPRKSGDTRALLRPYADLSATLVFFERKNRVLPTLELVHEVLGGREFCIARELTKKHEQFINGRLGQLPDFDGELLGEVTVVIGPPVEIQATSGPQVLALVQTLIREGVRPKDAARTVRDQVSGWSVKQIYEMIVEQDSE